MPGLADLDALPQRRTRNPWDVERSPGGSSGCARRSARVPSRPSVRLAAGAGAAAAERVLVDAQAADAGLHRARGRLREIMERGCELYRDEDGLACDRKE